MPTVEFLDGDSGRRKTIDTATGGDLVDLCDEVLAPVAFSCRSASCGTCQVEVLAGAELLEAASEEEQELLDLLDGPRNNRLACQARVKPGPGLIQLKPIGT